MVLCVVQSVELVRYALKVANDEVNIFPIVGQSLHVNYCAVYLTNGFL